MERAHLDAFPAEYIQRGQGLLYHAVLFKLIEKKRLKEASGRRAVVVPAGWLQQRQAPADPRHRLWKNNPIFRMSSMRKSLSVLNGRKMIRKGV
jgi:hypothetical protein